jgi:hypothetical protein|tara:strand:- start:2409 stop:2558 length:150 start_codon:yes stop_codon:yes gene_type:complete
MTNRSANVVVGRGASAASDDDADADDADADDADASCGVDACGAFTADAP